MIHAELRLAGVERVVDLWVGRDLLSALPSSEPALEGILFADVDVRARYREDLDAATRALIVSPGAPIDVAAGEESKDARTLPFLWEQLATRGLDRSARLVVAGGGSVLDLGGFLAATYLRGIPFISLPTTLLAQVDAAVGGKCGVNLLGAKNQVGSLWHPDAVFSDVSVLRTLPRAEWLSGLGEVVKTALVAGGDLMERVLAMDAARQAEDPNLEAVVALCQAAKVAVVMEDERESGRRMILNLGHTVGHVLESLALRGGTPLPHGVAVAVGILAEAEAHGAPAAVLDTVRRLLRHVGLPDAVAVPWDDTVAHALLVRDKKRRGQEILCPVLESPGRVSIRVLETGRLHDATRAVIAG